MNQSVPPVMAKDQFYPVLSQNDPFYALKGRFKFCLTKPTWSPVGKNQNGPEGASRYGQGPILTSINQISTQYYPFVALNCQFGVWVSILSWPPGDQKSKWAIGYLHIWPRTNPVKFHPHMTAYNAQINQFSVPLRK